MSTDLFQQMASQAMGLVAPGKTVVLRRRSTLRNNTTGALTTSLTVNGAHLAGVGVIDLQGTSLVGTLPSGAQITIAATVYTTTAAATTVNGQLVDVPITPVLAGNVSNGAAATVTTPYGSTTFSVLKFSTMTSRDGDNPVTEVADYALSASGATVTPTIGDLLVDGAISLRIADVKAPQPGAALSYWRVRVGGAA